MDSSVSVNISRLHKTHLRDPVSNWSCFLPWPISTMNNHSNSASSSLAMVYNSFCQERCLHPPPGQWIGNYFDRLPHKNNVFLARHGKALEWPSLPQSPRPWRCQRTWNKPVARRCRQMRTWGRTSWWTMVNPSMRKDPDPTIGCSLNKVLYVARGWYTAYLHAYFHVISQWSSDPKYHESWWYMIK